MIQKIHVNIPLLDVMHVPTYARYIKDIINNKRPLPTMEVVKLAEECRLLYSTNLQRRKKTRDAQQSILRLALNTSAMPYVTLGLALA